jgi:uncharacterized protein YndB with AHSA1/START domain
MPCEPGPPADVAVEREGDRFTLVFVRELAHPPAKVWGALTDPAALREYTGWPGDLKGAAGRQSGE